MTVDLLALGEVMLRLDPGAGRIRDATGFVPYVGGGEFNISHALSASFGMRTGIVTALAGNEVGELVRGLIRRSGVSDAHIRMMDDGGTGVLARNAINFTERGFGVRPALGVSDRAFSAAARMTPGSVDWSRTFDETAPRWFHTGGVFATLSRGSAELALEAVTAAKSRGVRVSYDVNFRPSLWRALEDESAHTRVICDILAQADLLISNEPEYRRSIGEPAAAPESQERSFARMVEDVRARFSGIGTVVATTRRAVSATRNDWGAVAWSESTGHVAAAPITDLEILDRVGGGDALVAGVIYGLLSGQPLPAALELGVASGALAMTTPGDTLSARRDEIEALASRRPIVAER